jgi:hypothetical protein
MRPSRDYPGYSVTRAAAISAMMGFCTGKCFGRPSFPLYYFDPR